MLLSIKRSGATMTSALDKLRETNPGKLPSYIAKSLPKFTAGIVLAVSFFYLTNVIAIYQWPPPADIVGHGFYTSLIIYFQRIPTSLYPFANLGFYYPVGLHVNAAFLSLVLGIYPGEAVLLFGGVLMIALTSLMFSLMYIITKSRMLSLSAYLLLFLTYSTQGGGNLEEWVFGYLFNGEHPAIYGFLIVLLLLTMIFIHAKTKDQRVLTRLYPMVMIVLLLTYPNFIFWAFLLFIFTVLQVGLRNFVVACFKTGRDRLFTAALIVLSAYFVLYVYFGIFNALASIGGLSPGYLLPQEYLLNSVFGVSIVSAFAFSCILIALSFVKTSGSSTSFASPELVELRPILLTYALIVVTLFLSLNSALYDLLQYFLPSRLLITAMIVSLIVNLYALTRIVYVLARKLFRYDLVNRQFTSVAPSRVFRSDSVAKTGRSSIALTTNRSVASGRVRGYPHRNKMPMNTVAAAFIILVFFSANGLLPYSLAAHFSFGLATVDSSSFKPYPFENDFGAMEWIKNNVKGGELILNDWSWDGLFLTSLSVMNVTMQYSLAYLLTLNLSVQYQIAALNRSRDLQNVWQYPQNATLVHSLLSKYDVSYVFSSGDWGYLDVQGASKVYKAKPYSPDMYVEFFSNYPFLDLVFVSGSSAVFRVK
jgi:hypothetical protein